MGYIFICPKCGKQYECPSMDGTKCGNCYIDTVCTGYSVEKWNQFDADKRAEIIAKISGKTDNGTATSTQEDSIIRTRKRRTYEASKWVNAYRIIAIISGIGIALIGILLWIDCYDFLIGMMYMVGGCIIATAFIIGSMATCELLENINKTRYEAEEIKNILDECTKQ